MSKTCEVCFSADEVTSEPAIDGLMEYTCDWTSKHPDGASHVWFDFKLSPAGTAGGSGRSLEPYYAPLRACFHEGEPWLEYAIVEWRFRDRAQALFAELLHDAGHIALEPKSTKDSKSTSGYLVMALGRMAARGELVRVFGPATGPWSHQAKVSYWALPPGPLHVSQVSWAQYADLNGLSANDISGPPGDGTDRTS